MEIDITRFVESCEPFLFSASVAEAGPNAGPNTWRNAVREGEASPLLTTERELEALRAHMRGYGAWEKAEIAAWSTAECNALFIQLVSGDMREAGMDDVFLDEFDWEDHRQRCEYGEISGCIYRGDDKRIYYFLGD